MSLFPSLAFFYKTIPILIHLTTHKCLFLPYCLLKYSQENLDLNYYYYFSGVWALAPPPGEECASPVASRHHPTSEECHPDFCKTP